MSYRPGDIPENRGDVNKWSRELTSRIRIELLAIARAISRQGASSGIGVGISGYGNQTAISTGGTFVPLKAPLQNYIVLYKCLNSSGEGVGVDLTGYSSSGFTATPLENATLHWTPLAIP